MSDVFLSHSELDADLIKLVMVSIERLDLDVVVEEERDNYGDEVVESVQDALKDCDCFVVILTERSIKSPWVNQEIGYACALGKVILPVWVGEVEIHRSGMIAGKKGVRAKSEDEDFNDMMGRILGFLIEHFDIKSFLAFCEECGKEDEWHLPDDDDLFRYSKDGEPMSDSCSKCGHENHVHPLSLLTITTAE